MTIHTFIPQEVKAHNVPSSVVSSETEYKYAPAFITCVIEDRRRALFLSLRLSLNWSLVLYVSLSWFYVVPELKGIRQITF